MRESIVAAARLAEVHPRDVCRAVDAGELECHGDPWEPAIEVSDIAVLDMQRYEWIGVAAWAERNAQQPALVEDAIAQGLLIGIDAGHDGVWVLEPFPVYAAGRSGVRRAVTVDA